MILVFGLLTYDCSTLIVFYLSNSLPEPILQQEITIVPENQSRIEIVLTLSVLVPRHGSTIYPSNYSWLLKTSGPAQAMNNDSMRKLG